MARGIGSLGACDVQDEQAPLPSGHQETAHREAVSTPLHTAFRPSIPSDLVPVSNDF